MNSVNETQEPDTLNRWLAIGGMAAAILFIPTAFVIGETRAGYSHVSQGISALSESGAPAAWAQSANFIILGVLTIGLAVGLQRGISHGKGSIVGPALIGAFGLLAGIGNGIFRSDPVGAPETLIGTLHSLTAGLGFVAVILSMFILPRRLRYDENWTHLAGIGRWMGAAASILMVVYLMAQEGTVEVWEPWTGLFQRALGASVMLWLFLLALRLYQTSRIEAPTV